MGTPVHAEGSEVVNDADDGSDEFDELAALGCPVAKSEGPEPQKAKPGVAAPGDESAPAQHDP